MRDAFYVKENRQKFDYDELTVERVKDVYKELDAGKMARYVRAVCFATARRGEGGVYGKLSKYFLRCISVSQFEFSICESCTRLPEGVGRHEVFFRTLSNTSAEFSKKSRLHSCLSVS